MKTRNTINSERCTEIYTVHALLIFSRSDTCWQRRIWRTDTFWFCILRCIGKFYILYFVRQRTFCVVDRAFSSTWYLGMSSSRQGSGLGTGRPRVSWRVILHENTVKTTFNTPCELLVRRLSGEDATGCCTKVGVSTLLGRVYRKLAVVVVFVIAA